MELHHSATIIIAEVIPLLFYAALGPPAEALMTEWVHHPHMNWKHQVEVLHDLLLCYGPGPTLGAIERVIEDDRLHAQAIAWVLKKEAV